MEFIIKYTAMILAFLIAIIGHEIMHGAVAKYYGDDTASREGRLSINPIKHIDPFGSIVFPILLYLSQKLAGVENPMIFGWAKPVPVNIFTVISKGGYLAAFAVSLAGVTYNFLLALIASSIIVFFGSPESILSLWMFVFLFYIVVVNIILAIFNLLPLPPLDGANALKYLALHFRWEALVKFYNKIEPYGILILLIVLFTPLGDYIFLPAYKLINALLY
ncbi:site-2 protease family protein [Caminibacter profundus]